MRMRRLARLRWRLGMGVGSRDAWVLESLAEAGANLRTAAELAARLFSTWPEDTRELRGEITDCEHRGDELTRRIVHALHRRRFGPFDRDDVHRLAGAIDDVVDHIEEAAEETAMYRIEAPLEQAEALAGVLRDASRDLAAALSALPDLNELESRIQGVRRREQEGDRIYRRALAALFEGGIDPMMIIRWKDVLAAIEEALDSARHAADIVHGIVVKHR